MADVEVLDRSTGHPARAPARRCRGAVRLRSPPTPKCTRYMSWTHASRRRRDPAGDHRVVQRRRRTDVADRAAGQWGDHRDSAGSGRCRRTACDFGYCLGRRWWGQGLMSEVVQLLLAEMEWPTPACTGSRRSVMSTTRVRPACWNAPACRSKAGWLATPSSRTSASEPQDVPAVRQGGQVTTPRTAHARAVNVKPDSVPETVAQPASATACRAGLGQRGHVDARGPLPAEERLPVVIE